MDIIDLIQRILDNGHGYVVTDADGKPRHVYFDVASWPHTANSLTRSRPPKSMRPPPWPTAWAPSVDATGADKYNPVDPADASPDKHDPRDFAL